MLALLGLLVFPKTAVANTASNLVFYVDDINKTKPFEPTKTPPPTPAVFAQPTTSPKIRRNPIKTTRSNNTCRCLQWAKDQVGFGVNGVCVASRHPINRDRPLLNALIFTNEGYWVWCNGKKVWSGHAGYVLSFTDTTVTIREANLSRCKVTTRTLNINDSRIRGFWSPTAQTM